MGRLSDLPDQPICPLTKAFSSSYNCVIPHTTVSFRVGAVLAGPCFDEENILHAELDLDDIARGKYDFDVAGHYARPDVFHLSVNENPQRPVT